MKRWIDVTWEATYIVICGFMAAFALGQFTRYPVFGWHPLLPTALVLVTFFAEVWLLRRSWPHQDHMESYYGPLLIGHILIMGLIGTIVSYKETTPTASEDLGFATSLAIIFSTVPILVIGVGWGIECHYEVLWPRKQRAEVAETAELAA